MSLFINEYAAEAARTAAKYDDPDKRLMVLALGLAGEAGEVADHIKKVVGHNHGFAALAILKELGDVLWYWSELVRAVTEIGELKVTPSDVAAMNIEKLRSRYPDGFSTEASLARADTKTEAERTTRFLLGEAHQTDPVSGATAERACGCAVVTEHAKWCEGVA